jgi:hypothetical protein
MTGQRDWPEILGVMAILSVDYPDELPVDGGAARCKIIEKRFAAGIPIRSTSDMECVWLGTDRGFYFAAPNFDRYVRWQWTETTVRPSKQGRKFARALVVHPVESAEVQLGSKGMTNLFIIQEWAKALGER